MVLKSLTGIYADINTHSGVTTGEGSTGAAPTISATDSVATTVADVTI